MYVCPGVEDRLADLAKATDASDTLTFTSVSTYVARSVAVGLLSKGGKPTIQINLERAKAEGADLSAQLLRLTEVLP